jgi:hypothetical protein
MPEAHTPIHPNTRPVASVFSFMDYPSEPGAGGREIRNVALLDLTGAQAASALDGISRISHVATILVSESLLPKLSRIAMDRVAATIPIPDGSRPKVFSGQITLSGEALANTAGQADDVLIVAGQLIITSPVRQVGYKDLIVVGQLVAPEGSEAALGSGLRHLSGQVVYYPYVEGARIRMHSGNVISGDMLANVNGEPTDMLFAIGQLVVTSPIPRLGYEQVVALGHVVLPKETDAALLGRFTAVSGQVSTYTAAPRIFDGKDHFSAGFFELFDKQLTLVLDGTFSFDDDVTPPLLRQKVAAIVLDGKIRAPRSLVPMLQMLCIARDGKIMAADEPE